MLLEHSNNGKYNLLLGNASKKNLGFSSFTKKCRYLTRNLNKSVLEVWGSFFLTNLCLIKSRPPFSAPFTRKDQLCYVALVISLPGISVLP